ncbi:hypothetical protein GHT06_017734 [Daphnia sinensis]|uniref:Uncharacterized protein n=1 Tax=Daphnia sinensis TaxID=1820382 RepID=A0AAD5KM74_9CRUS|nr:hypothetical protein GHT06_017734 [Daphnia sinensis]
MDIGHEESRLPLLNDSPSNTTVAAIFCSRNPLKTPDEIATSQTQCCVQHELKSSTKQSYSVSENLCIDDLKKLQEWLLLQIYSTSETLVELLQERQQLSEEAHVRLISIEQLHRLLEARCFYRGLSTGLFS